MAYRSVPIPPGSSNVESVSYDDETGNLQVAFVRDPNTPYVYYGVPGTVADGFTTSGMSAGKYLNFAIRNQFPFDHN